MTEKRIDWMPLVTLIGIIGALITALYTNKENRELEKLQYESSVIVKILENNPDSIKHKLQKLVNAGVLDPKSVRVLKIMNDTTLNIVFPKQVVLINDSLLGKFGSQKNGLWTFQVIDESGFPVKGASVKSRLFDRLRRTNVGKNAYFDHCVTDSLGVGAIELPIGQFIIEFNHPIYYYPNRIYKFEKFHFPDKLIVGDSWWD